MAVLVLITGFIVGRLILTEVVVVGRLDPVEVEVVRPFPSVLFMAGGLLGAAVLEILASRQERHGQ